ncbi:MAG: hypothetical protein WHS46_05085 [Desulfosoma sp.]
MNAQDILARMDALETRCPKLGHQVTFEYCRQESLKRPCSRALVCWNHRLPVEMILKKLVGEETYEAVFGGPPKSRVESLMEAIESAKQRCNAGGSGPREAPS